MSEIGSQEGSEGSIMMQEDTQREVYTNKHQQTTIDIQIHTRRAKSVFSAAKSSKVIPDTRQGVPMEENEKIARTRKKEKEG